MNFNIYNIEAPKYFYKTNSLLNKARLFCVTTSIAMAGISVIMSFVGMNGYLAISTTLFIALFAATLVLTNIQQSLLVEAEVAMKVLNREAIAIDELRFEQLQQEVEQTTNELAAALTTTRTELETLKNEINDTNKKVKSLASKMDDSLSKMFELVEDTSLTDALAQEINSIKQNVASLKETVVFMASETERNALHDCGIEIEQIKTLLNTHTATPEQLETLSELIDFYENNAHEVDLIALKEELVELKLSITYETKAS